jgi:hypothetical protein
MIWRAILGMSVCLALCAGAARGCTCAEAQPGTCTKLQTGDVAFLGTVTEAELVLPPAAAARSESNGSSAAAQGPNSHRSTATLLIHYKFHVDEIFAGPDATDIDLYSGGDDGDCGYRFQKGSQYLVFPQKETDERLFVTKCSETRPAADALALLPQLRAMKAGQHVASVFGVLRRADAPFLAAAGDPDEPLPDVALQLRSKYDRFRTTTDQNGVYSFYDVHEGTYSFTADLPARLELTQKTLMGGLPPFKIPNGACYEYNVDALPTGHIQGTVDGPDGKPLRMASLELYRAGEYSDSRPGLWSFQGARGVFDFDHVGPGEYILVYNRLNRMDPNSPYPRAFYPGVSDIAGAKVITLKDGQDLTNVKMTLGKGYATHPLRVHLKWTKQRPLGTVTVEVKAAQGNNPAAEKVADGLWEFTLLDSGEYTVSAYEVLRPPRTSRARQKGKDRTIAANVNTDCTIPPRIDTAAMHVSGADSEGTDIVLTFPELGCGNE